MADPAAGRPDCWQGPGGRFFFLAIGLFIATLGLGYLIWQVVAWDQGQTPAQRLLGLRCWRRDTREVAGRKYMALRQGTGLLLNGER